MSAAEDTAAKLEALQKLVESQQEQIAALSQRQAEIPAELLAQQRAGVEAALDAPLKTYPLGSREMDFRPRRVREREMAIAKMQQVAVNHGGFWHPDPTIPSKYGHYPFDAQKPWREACAHLGETTFAEKCQHTCWTPESETRFLHALRLKDLATGELVRLGPADPVTNQDALRELVGLLKGPQSNMKDAYGRYPSQDEVSDVAQDTRRKVMRV